MYCRKWCYFRLLFPSAFMSLNLKIENSINVKNYIIMKNDEIKMGCVHSQYKSTS